jgi:hypothetical protein
MRTTMKHILRALSRDYPDRPYWSSLFKELFGPVAQR